MPAEWSLPAVHDVIAETIPDAEMIVWGAERRTFAQVAERSRGLARFLAGRGIGCHVERAELQPWEKGQDSVAIVMYNRPEYLEALFGALRARAVPFNVNQHYRPHEVASLFASVDARAVVYQRRLGPLLAEAGDVSQLVLIDVDDHSGVAPLPGSTPFEEAVATTDGELPTPSPDDLFMMCTGGTTGSPKAVLWRQADMYVGGMSGSPDATAESIAAMTGLGLAPWFAAPPLMHAAAQLTAFSAWHLGATIVLHDDSQPFDARTILDTTVREGVGMLVVVGDAYARPLVDELRLGNHDLTGLQSLASGGAAMSERYKQELFELLPHVTVIDGYGASETGNMASGARAKGDSPNGFSPSAGTTVIALDRSRFLQPGDDEVGWTARVGNVPLGYLGDQAKTEDTFVLVEGKRTAIPGDRGRFLPDGTIEMLGRDSLVINTGGEKVFVEEVEEVLHEHPAVADCLVVGRASERFGQEVVAVVSLHPGTSAEPTELREHVASRIARFKAPRAVLICDEVRRHPSGKADYRWAKEAAEAAVPATA